MKSTQIEYRRFRPEDLPEILRIQNQNLLTRLTPAEQADGFLTVAFPARRFLDMHAQIPIVVADAGPRLAGFLCGTSLAYSRSVPLLAHMMTLFGQTHYRNRPLDSYRSFIYGPVCIDRPLRGRGLLEGLFETQMQRLAGRFEIGTLFVSRNNPRSLNAHTRHLPMTVVAEFTFDQKDFHLLAFDVPPKP